QTHTTASACVRWVNGARHPGRRVQPSQRSQGVAQHPRESTMDTRFFLHAKLLGLTARARRLARVDYAAVGIRPQDMPYAPSPAHFRAANQRLAQIDGEIRRRLEQAQERWATAPFNRVLVDIAM